MSDAHAEPVATLCPTLINITFLHSFYLRAGALSPAPAVDFDNLPDLPASEAVELLCSRAITAVDYVEALDSRYQSGDYACNNPWITYNISKVLA